MMQNANGGSGIHPSFFTLLKNPVKFRLFLIKNLPAAYFSGVRLRKANENECHVSIPYKWLTRNPFRSTYFASMSMAAEMSTGILAMGNTYKRDPKVSLLVTAIEGRFYKRATERILFVCHEGQLIKQTVQEAVNSGEARSVRVLSAGKNKSDELVAEFWITWSFKTKQNAT